MVSITQTAEITPGSPTPGSGRHSGLECVRAAGPRPEDHRARPASEAAACPARGQPSSRQRHAQVARSAGGQRRGQHCSTPSTPFPAQPPTAKVPEMREAGRSKTSRSQKPKTWEPKQRPKPREAGRQRDWSEPSSHCLPCPHAPDTEGPWPGLQARMRGTVVPLRSRAQLLRLLWSRRACTACVPRRTPALPAPPTEPSFRPAQCPPLLPDLPADHPTPPSQGVVNMSDEFSFLR